MKVPGLLAAAFGLGLASWANAAESIARHDQTHGQPFLINVDNKTAIIGNDHWNVTIGRQYGTKLYYKGVDLVKDAVGHYVSYNGAQSDLNLTNARVHKRTEDYTDIVFTAVEGDFHWVLTPTLTGAYQYFVNRALPVLGEFRTLWRLSNDSFTEGWTAERVGELPPLSDIVNAPVNVEDETWQRSDGTYITKYDFAAYMHTVQGDETFWGVYGTLEGKSGRDAEGIGSWYIHGGKDYFNGDHLKQELMVHRESATGDSVQLNMIHGTHFMATATDAFPVGKTWGPWLWYLNDGDVEDVRAMAKKENEAWPYRWMQDDLGFHERGEVSGRVTLSDGRPAANAAIFLGDNYSTNSSLDQGAWYYYRTWADRHGNFALKNVREGTYALRAAPNGGVLGDVTTSFQQDDVVVKAKSETRLEHLVWHSQGRKAIWQVGEIDRLATGFAHSGAPHDFGRGLKCPNSTTFIIGKSMTSDWCFEQSKLGSWDILFDLPERPKKHGDAVLTLSLAGFSTGSSADILINEHKIGNISSSYILSDPSSYRCGTLGGEPHMFEIPIQGTFLKKTDNVVAFNVTTATESRGWIYDSILLEWA